MNLRWVCSHKDPLLELVPVQVGVAPSEKGFDRCCHVSKHTRAGLWNNRDCCSKERKA